MRNCHRCCARAYDMIRLGDRAQMACCVARKTRVRAPVFTMPLFPAAAARPPAESISRYDLRGPHHSARQATTATTTTRCDTYIT
ncbi:hypothetical protein SFRURICE_018400 [Spodoptera frugiperda]|uniref:SFRICE_041642 n=1 Tax=Spodoptera frugiperda TaxID=7108 RepID=A0A2H1WNP8_SPOFR|nr:hypothetical protein SFRURICE_018400 [Spodoptera frugiperda]